ncbi:[FeFe] hydrogenase, group A, partial [bacterium]|nr:[FeFe] hydrogenase, group A [bacterium]
MQITINNKKVKVNKDWTILQAAQKAGINIPTLCYHPDLKPEGRCGICIVEADGNIMTSCNNLVKEGMIVKTNTEKVIKYRKINIQLIGCNFEKENEFKKWLKIQKMSDVDELKFKPRRSPKIDDSAHDIIMDFSKCILCGRCIQKCKILQTVNAISYKNRANATTIDKALGKKLIETYCVGCGQCTLVCPTGAIKEKEYIEDVKKALADKNKHVIVQTAPSVRVAIGEEFGMPAGSLVTGEMVTALRKIGFAKIFDTNLGADLTIMEEANELVKRIKEKKNLPLITSCCPGWVSFIEKFFPEMLNHLSTCKSPHQMFGAIAKSYYAQKFHIDPKNIILVSIMPCTAKKYESCRPEMIINDIKDVDYVITTRETAKLMKEMKIDLSKCSKSDFDKPLGAASGGGAIFGTTGGVMESAIRTAHNIITGQDLKNINFQAARGMDGIKKAEVKIGKLKLKIAIVHSLSNARKIMEEIKKDPQKYDFIEVMACPGGCIGGGGQPKPSTMDIAKKRSRAIYQQDKILKVRQAHRNPQIHKLYLEFLKKPLS